MKIVALNGLLGYGYSEEALNIAFSEKVDYLGVELLRGGVLFLYLVAAAACISEKSASVGGKYLIPLGGNGFGSTGYIESLVARKDKILDRAVHRPLAQSGICLTDKRSV